MAKIASVKGREILDSRGNPTIQVTVTLTCGISASSNVPSGASKGIHEALELTDQNQERYLGKGVEKAVSNVNGPIQEILLQQSVFDQEKIDNDLIALDGTPQKSRLGANALLGVSQAVSKAGAKAAGLPLYRYLGGTGALVLPCPMINILNGGAHADNPLDIQEFMIRPKRAPTFKEAIRHGAEIFHHLKALLKKEGLSISVGDEGGFAPQIATPEVACEWILRAIEKAGLRPGEDVSLALDLAASEFFDKEKGVYYEKKKRLKTGSGSEKSSDEHIDHLASLLDRFPIDSLEDPLDESDWQGWQRLTQKLGSRCQVVGDDLFVTQLPFLKKGIELKAANAILIKPNQVGTVSETEKTIDGAKRAGFGIIVSHRSGETEDTFIADLAVAANTGQIKTGSLCRSERVAKYNRLLAIEEELGPSALYLDGNVLFRQTFLEKMMQHAPVSGRKS